MPQKLKYINQYPYLPLFFCIKKKVTIHEKTSAADTDIQIPSAFKIIGKIITAEIWKTMVLKNEINAETGPLFNAVNMDEPKIFIPANKNINEKILNPLIVSANKSAS